jgi:hypothetical protein
MHHSTMRADPDALTAQQTVLTRKWVESQSIAELSSKGRF